MRSNIDAGPATIGIPIDSDPRLGSACQKGNRDAQFISEALALEAESAKNAGTMGFMARVLVQTTLPHSIQNGPRYTRRNGMLTVSVTDLSGAGLPYGSYPRLLLIWLTTEACRTKNRQLELGPSLSSFMAELGLMSTGGRWGTIPRLKDQMARLFSAAISATSISGESTALHHHGGKNLLVADDFDLWWSPHSPDQTTLWRSTVTLSEALFQQVIDRPVPVDLRAVKLLKKSPMALDLYALSNAK